MTTVELEFEYETPDGKTPIEALNAAAEKASECPLPAHWQTGCSNAGRWVNCPGSKYAEDSDGGFLADLGTLGHKVTEQLLRHHFGEFKTTLYSGEFKTNFEIDLDDADRATLAKLDLTQLDWFKKSIKTCYNAVLEFAGLERDTSAGHHGADEILFETKIKSDTIDKHGGTIDVIMWFAMTKLLIVIDFKFGMVAVDCEGNEQIMSYLNLARQHFPKARKYQGVIVQPSYNGVDVQKFTKKKLDIYATRAWSAAQPDNMERHGDTKWCEYCPLLSTCDAAAKFIVSAVEEFGTLAEFINQGDKWTPARIERLERIVLMHKLAKNAYEKASTLLKQLHDDGHPLNYHRVTSGQYRSWLPSAEDQLTMLYGSDIVTTKVMSPNELQKMLEMKKTEFDKTHSHLLELTSRPTLKAGVKPNAGELAADLPFFDDSQS